VKPKGDERGASFAPARLVALVRGACERRAVFMSLFIALMIGFPMVLYALPIFTGAGDNVIVVRISGTMVPEVYVPDNIQGNSGASLQVWVMVVDGDGDAMHVEFEWGDGTPNGTYESAPGFEEITTVYHAWNPVPIQGQGDYNVTYTVNITAYDPDGMSATGSLPAIIKVPSNSPPAIHINAPLKVDPADNVTIEVYANDAEGEPLTWTYFFNNTDTSELVLADVRHTEWTLPGEAVFNNISQVFGVSANFTLVVYVSDALPGYQVGIHNATEQSLKIESIGNTIPTLGALAFTPSNTKIDEIAGYIQVNFSVECLDPDSDPMNLTWDFGDGTFAYNESVGVRAITFNQTRNYTEVGSFYINVTLTDGRPGHALTSSLLLNITGTNLPPIVSVEYQYASGDFALTDEVITFTINGSDPEEDPIQLIIDFGDGSPLEYYNLTVFVDGLSIITVNHSYSTTGQKTIFLNYTDNRKGIGDHAMSTQVLVDVDAPDVIIVSKWSWWDYTGLGMFAMIPLVIAARLLFVARRRKKADEEGVTLEEWYILQEQMRTGQKNGKAKSP